MVDKDFYDGEKWNMAMAYHQRIDDLLTACTVAHMKGDGLGWYNALYRLYVEIEAKIKPELKEEAKKKIEGLTNWKTEAINKTKGSISTAKFIEVELFLRQILEDKNMLTPKPEDLRGL